MVHFAPMGRRKFRRTSEAYRRLLKYIAEYQGDNGEAPTSFREIGLAIGTSHSQVRRLLLKAEKGGLLRRSSADALAYDIIRTPPTSGGLAWVARVACSWTRGIEWVRDEADGVWLDRDVYDIKPGGERWLWALTFPDSKLERGAGILKLRDRAMALVRRCKLDEMQYHAWYVIERQNREVLVSTLYRKTRGKWAFRVSIRDESPVIIDPKDITRVSEILMVTMRPSPPPRLSTRKESRG